MSSFSWQQSFIKTLPVMLGYIPLGIAFGVLAVQMGFPWWFAPLTSIAIYSGASQFLILSLLTAGASLSAIFVAVFLLSTRHIFYGLSLLARYKDAHHKKPYLIFALTDETYTLLTSSPDRSSDFKITLLNQTWWFSGTVIGVLIASLINFDSSGMEFALTALFIVLSVELYKSNQELKPLVIGLLSAVLALFLLPKQHMLLAAISASSLVILIEFLRAKHER